MTRTQSEVGKARFQREALTLCPTCEGSGMVLSETVKERARKGGVHSYLKSLEPGQLSMSERGKKGGRPKEPFLSGLPAIDRGVGSVSPKE